MIINFQYDDDHLHSDKGDMLERVSTPIKLRQGKKAWNIRE